MIYKDWDLNETPFFLAALAENLSLRARNYGGKPAGWPSHSRHIGFPLDEKQQAVVLVDFTQLSYSQWSSEAVQWSGEVCVSYKFRAP